MRRVLVVFTLSALTFAVAGEPAVPAPEEKKESPPAEPVPAPAPADDAAAKAEMEKAKEAERLAREQVRQQSDLERNMRAAIRRLATSGWRDAANQLVSIGKPAVPLLIEAMSEEAEPVAAYTLGGHTRADSGRARRQRTLAEVCAEVLTEMVSNHSNFKGELPSVDQKAWQSWWAASAETIAFGK